MVMPGPGMEAGHFFTSERIKISARPSTAWEISFADRFLVPLNNMCSMKWQTPFISGGS